MPDYTPNCSITVYFVGGDAATNVKPQFKYHATSCSQGWQVLPDGSIHPPSKRRIVEIRLDAYPINLENPPRFAGFRMGLMSAAQKESATWTSETELADLGVTILTPGYPTDPKVVWKTFGPLAFDMTGATDRLVYSLAVSIGDSEPIWDDPKIYDDGSE